MKRSNVVIKNTIWEMGYYLMVIAFGFLAPRLIILVYGSEVNGLSSSITQILNVLILLQCGATTAAVFSLYRPIAENNKSEIDSIVSYITLYFKRLSYIFLVLMIIVALITAMTLQSSISRPFIFLAFIFMGLKNFLDLFFICKYRVVFTAFEQKFYISIGTLIEQIVYYSLIFITLYFNFHYIWIYLWLLLGCIIKVIFLRIIYKKNHPNIHVVQINRKNKMSGTNYALANEVSHSVVSSSISIFISFMYGLKEASVYSVYTLVSTAISLITTAIYSAFAPSFGNIVAQKNEEYTKRTFQIFQFIFVGINIVMLMCMLYLFVPFVKIYTHGANDVEYVNISLACLLTLQGLFSALRVPYNIAISSFGFFKETWIQPVVSAFISILLSFIIGNIDYSFILIGPIVFYILNYIYQHIKLSKLVPYLITYKSYVLCTISIIGLIISLIMCKYVPVPEDIISWLLYAFISFFCACLYFIGTAYLFAKKLLYESISFILNLVKRRIK